jgi:GTP-binding protein Era
VIGKQGEKLKKIGIDARKDIENLIHKKVYLQLWVKVKKGWSDNERALQSLGFNE